MNEVIRITPGPWQFEFPDDGDADVGVSPTTGFVYHETQDGSTVPICTIDDPCYADPSETDPEIGLFPVYLGTVSGNITAIAAVPDLIAACRKLDELDWCVGYDLVGPQNHVILDAALTMARAALAKIDGGKS